MRRFLVFGLIIAALVLAACGGAETEPTAAVEPTAAAEPAVAPEPTAAPEPTKDSMPAMGEATVMDGKIMLPEVNPLEVTGDVIAAGSSTVFPLAEVLAERFIDEGYGGNITIDSIGSGAGSRAPPPRYQSSCLPTDTLGTSDRPACWGTRTTRRPRSARHRRSSASVTSSPPISRWSAAASPVVEAMPSSALQMLLLPLPDAPTIARTSPASTWRSIPRTACTRRVPLPCHTCNPRTSSAAGAPSPCEVRARSGPNGIDLTRSSGGRTDAAGVTCRGSGGGGARGGWYGGRRRRWATAPCAGPPRASGRRAG